jgi:hypothetical protein
MLLTSLSGARAIFIAGDGIETRCNWASQIMPPFFRLTGEVKGLALACAVIAFFLCMLFVMLGGLQTKHRNVVVGILASIIIAGALVNSGFNPVQTVCTVSGMAQSANLSK